MERPARLPSPGAHRLEQEMRIKRIAIVIGVAAAPDNASACGGEGGALVELGRYSEAFATFQRMIDIRPDLSSYARASYARELQGDVPGAIADMNLALQAASSPADAAWANYQ